MDYNSMVMILGILYWVLCACAAVTFLIWIYTQVVYLSWNREDRMRENIVNLVEKDMVDKPDELGYDNQDEKAPRV